MDSPEDPDISKTKLPNRPVLPPSPNFKFNIRGIELSDFTMVVFKYTH